jgi:hypothetical protein
MRKWKMASFGTPMPGYEPSFSEQRRRAMGIPPRNSDSDADRIITELLIARIRQGAENGQTDTKTDTEKKTGKKRPMTKAAADCAGIYKRRRRNGDKTAMKYVVEEYVEQHPDESASSILRILTDNSNAWKTDKKRTR